MQIGESGQIEWRRVCVYKMYAAVLGEKHKRLSSCVIARRQSVEAKLHSGLSTLPTGHNVKQLVLTPWMRVLP